jgi:hypothetical protein
MAPSMKEVSCNNLGGMENMRVRRMEGVLAEYKGRVGLNVFERY